MPLKSRHRVMEYTGRRWTRISPSTVCWASSTGHEDPKSRLDRSLWISPHPWQRSLKPFELPCGTIRRVKAAGRRAGLPADSRSRPESRQGVALCGIVAYQDGRHAVAVECFGAYLRRSPTTPFSTTVSARPMRPWGSPTRRRSAPGGPSNSNPTTPSHTTTWPTA